jgi:hypothetical protein
VYITYILLGPSAPKLETYQADIMLHMTSIKQGSTSSFSCNIRTPFEPCQFYCKEKEDKPQNEKLVHFFKKKKINFIVTGSLQKRHHH